MKLGKGVNELSFNDSSNHYVHHHHQHTSSTRLTAALDFNNHKSITSHFLLKYLCETSIQTLDSLPAISRPIHEKDNLSRVLSDHFTPPEQNAQLTR